MNRKPEVADPVTLPEVGEAESAAGAAEEGSGAVAVVDVVGGDGGLAGVAGVAGIGAAATDGETGAVAEPTADCAALSAPLAITPPDAGGVGGGGVKPLPVIAGPAGEADAELSIYKSIA